MNKTGASSPLKSPSPRMIVLELTGAEKHFLDKYVTEGHLPTFEKLLQQGKLLKTKISTLNFPTERGQSSINLWAIWPSIYTGLAPSEHGIVGFGQESQVLQGQYIWDQLNALSFTTGVFGSLVGAPFQNNPKMLFYLPGILASIPSCFPKSYQIIQDFFAFSELSTTNRSFFRAIHLYLKLGLAVLKQKIPNSILKSLFRLITMEFYKGLEYQKKRFLLHTQLQMEVFQALYQQYKPDFATFHLNHIAYAQHLYWRATEPERFKDKLGELDGYFFTSVEERKTYEDDFKEVILDSFKVMDQFLEKLEPHFEQDTLLVILTGMGQKNYDPVHQIHKPEIRLIHIEQLLKFVDVTNCEILSQMNPDLTLNFKDAADASLAAFKLSNLKVLSEYPLFYITQKENQLFLEETLPQEMWFVGEEAWLENISNEHIVPLFDFVRMSPLKGQHSAHDVGTGWMLLYGNLDGLPTRSARADTLEITEIYPLLLGYFNGTLNSGREETDDGIN